MKTRQKHAGFTMIELLVVATIIILLSAIGLVSFSQANKRARDGKRKADLEQARSALELYRSDNGFYPATNSWTTLISTLNTGGYLNTATMVDPKNVAPYLYSYCASLTSGGACVTSGTPKYYYVQATCEITTDPACPSSIFKLNNP